MSTYKLTAVDTAVSSDCFLSSGSYLGFEEFSEEELKKDITSIDVITQGDEQIRRKFDLARLLDRKKFNYSSCSEILNIVSQHKYWKNRIESKLILDFIILNRK